MEDYVELFLNNVQRSINPCNTARLRLETETPMTVEKILARLTLLGDNGRKRNVVYIDGKPIKYINLRDDGVYLSTDAKYMPMFPDISDASSVDDDWIVLSRT